MKKLVLSDFTGGMIQRISPEDYAPGEWGLLRGLIPDDDKRVRSQWGIQSVGVPANDWTENGQIGGVANTAQVMSVYPLKSGGKVYLVAIKQDGTIWWAPSPEIIAGLGGNPQITANYGQSSNIAWQRIQVAQNQGFQADEPYTSQPTIYVESNPDYRFICDVPLEVYKYTKRATPLSQYESATSHYERTGTTAKVWFATPHSFKVGDSIHVTDTGGTGYNGYWTVTGINPTGTDYWVTYTTVTSSNDTKTADTNGNVVNYWPDFTRDEIPDPTILDDETGAISSNSAALTARSTLSGVLIHSRRYYNGEELARTKDLNTSVAIASLSVTSNVVTVNTSAAHGLTTNDTAYVYFESNTYDDLNGRYYVTVVDSDTFTFSATFGNTGTTSVTGSYTHRVFRTQTAVVCYVDPYAVLAGGEYMSEVKAVTFPNVRRWPSYAYDGNAPTFAKSYLPMESNVVKTDLSTDDFPFLSKYPFVEGELRSIDTTDSNSNRSSYPKHTHVFHPYTYLDWEKVLKPGTGIIPRCFTGTMWGTNLILGDIEWREDASSPYIVEKRLDKKKNTVAGASDKSAFGLRDGNTEPHRGFLYYSESEIDRFDPISVLKASSTDARIAGMHAINNRLVVVTTAGGLGDGVITFAGNLSQLHPYTPGALANPNAVRRELVRGGVGTADTDDQYNHGNPQTTLWSDRNLVAFIDQTGYVMVTDGQQAQVIDERYPLIGRPAKSTVNDHVAAVGRYLFVYRNGHLMCYTKMSGGRGAWSFLIPPQPRLQLTGSEGYFRTFSTIRSMRGIANELYMVVHYYTQECDANYEPLPNTEPVFAKSQVMRYALANEDERGTQNGIKIDGIELHTPVLGNGESNTKINWHEVAVNFTYNQDADVSLLIGQVNPARLVGVSVTNRYSKEEDVQAGDYTVPGGSVEYPVPNTTSLGNPIFGDSLYDPTQVNEPDNETNYKTVRTKAGIGPNRTLTAKFRFWGDVSIDSVEIWYSGQSPAISGKAE
jgi:hypothetical protein